MRNKIGLLVSVFILLSLEAGWAASASEDAREAPEQITSSVSVAMKHFIRTVLPPKSAGKGAIAAKIDISVPELTCRSGSNAALEAINKAIQSRLLASMTGQVPATVEELMENFGKEYERSMTKAPEMPGAWSLKVNSSIRHADEDLFSLRILRSIFTGGAHPTSHVDYLVFSMKTGEQIDLTALIPESNMGELTLVAETHFRQVRRLMPQMTYEQAGFRFKKNQFSLNRNFLVSKAGLAFCYNQSEIAPYAKGITELVIPWSELKRVADAGGLAGRFLKEK